MPRFASQQQNVNRQCCYAVWVLGGSSHVVDDVTRRNAMPAVFSTVERFFRPRIEESDKFFFRAEEAVFLGSFLGFESHPRRQDKFLSGRDLLY